jgi:cellulose synthase operon protein C
MPMSLTPFFKILSLQILFIFFSLNATASDEVKGTLPEVKLNSNNEDVNQSKSLKSELMITNAENKAIIALQKVIQKRKGSKEEPDLLFRLAELYMRRAKSGRFFDLQGYTLNNNNVSSESKVVTEPAKPKAALEALTNAMNIYNRIQKAFPKFERLDEVLFNNALAHSQTNQSALAKQFYNQLINDYPRSALVPDALLEVGELEYNDQKFQLALDHFLKIENFPKSKAYPYGIYKSAWCYYNLKETEQGIEKLTLVVRKNSADEKDDRKYNLRKEALRDLTLFVGETMPPQQLYSFFNKLANENELGEVILNLAKLYESHSRYKEISLFAKEFIDKNPQNDFTPSIYVKLIETNETLKNRPLVIEDLKKMANFCKFSAATTCTTEFRKVSLEISKKWWEIWLKNKNNVEFSNLTERSFEILLSMENPDVPDSVSRYAYAELLFQQGKYAEAQKNYEDVSKNETLDKTKKHDSLYASLFCTEKLIDQNKETSDPILVLKQKELATRYISEFPTGEHADQLSFKLGFLAYKDQDLDSALKQLTPFTSKTKNQELKVKAQDIILDIYNLKKDFPVIRNMALEFLKTTDDEKRKVALNQIVEESQFSDIQKQSESLDAAKKIQMLKEFTEKYKNSKLSQDASWQTVSLAYSNGFDVMGADLSVDYAKKYPDDKRNLDSIKEALKSYIDSGLLVKAIQTSRDLARLEPAKGFEHLETSCDLLHINSQLPEARGCYRGLFEKSSKEKKFSLLTKMKNTYNAQPVGVELASIENQILQENIEPYATQILISRARSFLDNNKISEAFNLSLKINARDVDTDIRAEARLIQAQILEREFVKQSLKAKESRFALVLSLKTEKLDKAFTAYSTTVKMSKDSKVQAQALQGIDRLYTHFVEAVSTMPIPDTLTPADQQSLREELVKLSEPFNIKKTENLAKLRKLTQLSATPSEEINWTEFSVEKTVEPRLKFPPATMFKSYYPSDFNLSSQSARLPATINSCKPTEISAVSIGGCIQIKRYIDAEKMALQLTQTKDQRAVGLFYLGLIADQKNELDKATWMLNKSLKLQPENSIVTYQLAKVSYSVDGIDSALPLFERIIDIKKNSPELTLLSGLKAFSDRDYLTAIEEFSRFSTEELYNYNIDELYVESYAQKGDLKGARQLAEKLIKARTGFGDGYVDMHLQLARVYEQFEYNKVAALPIYEKALSKSTNLEQKEWIKKKISFLKIKPTETQITKHVDE